MSSSPELSIIIPTLNEAKSLPLLINDLLSQKNISFEIIIVDGGSSDGTCELVKSLVYPAEIGIRLLRTPAGRGLQMNAGAKLAAAAELLFLHADSRIDYEKLLTNGLESIRQKRAELEIENIAGHFGIKFRRNNKGNNKAYYFYEAKTRLNRKGCINGDQGIFLSRQYFHLLGMYDESLTYMEDFRLASKIFESGCWVTLPGSLQTSARRFEQEGFTERQTLNALISNFEDMGQYYFLQSAKDIYQTQADTRKIVLKPYFKLANQAIYLKGFFKGMIIWYKTGRYVAQNAWQLAFAMDCTRNAKAGLLSGKGKYRWLYNYDRWISFFITSPIGNFLTAIVTAIWFYGTWLSFKNRPD